MHEILSPHVEELVVTGIRDSRGQKSDVLDASRRAEGLRTGTIKTQVFEAPEMYSRPRDLPRVHGMSGQDVVRVQGRLLLASPGFSTAWIRRYWYEDR